MVTSKSDRNVCKLELAVLDEAESQSDGGKIEEKERERENDTFPQIDPHCT